MCCGGKHIKTERCPKCGALVLVMKDYIRCRKCQFIKRFVYESVSTKKT